MLPSNVQAEIEKRWEATSPLNIVRPIIIIDLVTYLLFVKRLDELQSFLERKAADAAFTLENPVFRKEQAELRWSYFKNLDRDNLHRLFVKEGGIIDFIKEYSNGPHIFSNFLRTPLILKPTPILLENAVSIVKSIDAADEAIRGEMYNYLLNKAAINNKSNQLPVPAHIVKMMVTMMAPTPDDIIYDPSAGMGTFLLACADYLKTNNQLLTSGDEISGPFLSETLFGTEHDPVLLRMGAMNMLLHGIEDPQIKEVTMLKEGEEPFGEEATLAFANPPLSRRTNYSDAEEITDVADSRQTGLMYLALLLSNLKQGGRAAVIVPESVLMGNSTAHKQLRQHLLDNNKVEGVISLPGGIFRPYSGIGTDIILLKKEAPDPSAKVWFYSMQNDGFTLNEKRSRLEPITDGEVKFPDDYGDVADILNKWENRQEEEKKEASGNSFFIPLQRIRENGYNLKSVTYKATVGTPKVENKPPVIVPPLSVPPVEPEEDTIKKSAFEVLQEKRAIAVEGPLAKATSRQPRLILLSVLVLSLIAIAAYFLLTNKSLVKGEQLAVQTNNLPQPQQNRAEKERTNDSNRVTTTGNQSINILNKNSVNEALAEGKSFDNGSDLNDSLEQKNLGPILVSDAPKRISVTRYKVISKTSFYNAPSETARRRSSSISANNSFGPIKALDEKNGFIYVALTDKKNRTYQGWLRKKDMGKVTMIVYDSDVK